VDYVIRRFIASLARLQCLSGWRLAETPPHAILQVDNREPRVSLSDFSFGTVAPQGFPTPPGLGTTKNRKLNKMKFTKQFSAAIIIAATASAVSVCSAQTSANAAAPTAIQSSAPYTEGGVWQITMVKTKPGMSDDYLRALAKIFKSTNEEAKRQGIITDYKILAGDAATQQDFDILLMTQYPNMAALDGLRDKTDPIGAKLVGTEDQQRQLAVKRLEIRDIMGGKTMREITLK
jgi:hypothetical protein